MITKEHFAWLDRIRTIAMALVVLSHSCDYMIRVKNGYHPLWHSLVSCLTTVSVPTFFVISGYLIVLRGGDGGRHFYRLLRPYCLWSVIFYLIHLKIYNLPLTNLNLIFEALSGARHLYFLFALMQLHILLKITYFSITKNNINSLLILYGLFTLFIYVFSDVLSWAPLRQTGLNLIHFEGLFVKFGMTWGLFYFLGVFLAFRPTALKALAKKSRPLLFLTAVCFVVYFWEYNLNANANDNGVTRKYLLLTGLLYQLFGALTFVSFFYATRDVKGKFYSWLVSEGKSTFGIYLVHPAILLFFVILIRSMNVSQNVVLPIAIFLFFLSWFSSSCLMKVAGLFITGQVFLNVRSRISQLIT